MLSGGCDAAQRARYLPFSSRRKKKVVERRPRLFPCAGRYSVTLFSGRNGGFHVTTTQGARWLVDSIVDRLQRVRATGRSGEPAGTGETGGSCSDASPALLPRDLEALASASR